MNYNKHANVFKALGDATRLEIVLLLKKEGTLCACEILEKFKITQPTLSYHMKILTDSKIVDFVKKGKWNYYSINLDVLNLSLNFLQREDLI